MPLPKRIYLENQIYFITTNTYDRNKLFDNQVICDLFIKILSACQKIYKYKIYGYVVMSDHVHLLIEPDKAMTISDCMHRIKGNFAYQYLKARKHKDFITRKINITMRNHEGSATRRKNKSDRVGDALPSNRVGDVLTSDRVGDPLWVADTRIRQKPVWQKSFYDHIIRNEKDFEEKLNYIHENPIRAGLAKTADQYQYSSFGKYFYKI